MVGVSGLPGVCAAEHVMWASGGGTAQGLIRWPCLGDVLVRETVLSLTHVASTLVVVRLFAICPSCTDTNFS